MPTISDFRPKRPTPRRSKKARNRQHRLQLLESRLMLAADWQNEFIPQDVSGDDNVTAVDALQIINELGATRVSTSKSGEIASPRPQGAAYYDVNGDDHVTAQDALLVINTLNSNGRKTASGQRSVDPASGAPWQPSDETRVNEETHRAQSDPDIAMRATGDHIVVWASIGQDGMGGGIYGQRYDSLGQKAGPEFQINQYTPKGQLFPSVDIRDDGQFVVVWQSWKQDTYHWGLYGRRYDADGSPLSDEFQINQTTRSNQRHASVRYLDDGGFAIVWEGRGNDDIYGIYARTYDADGNPRIDETQLNETKPEKQFNASVDSLGEGFIVAWDGNGVGDDQGIFFRAFDALANAATPEQRLNRQTANPQEQVSIRTLGDQRFVATWSGKGQDGSGWGVYANVFDATGEAAGDEWIVNQTTDGGQRTPDATGWTDHELIIAWQGNGDGDSDGVYVRRFDLNGQPAGDEILVNDTLNDRQRNVAIAGNGRQLQAVWDGRGIGDWRGVFKRAFNPGVSTIADEWLTTPGISGQTVTTTFTVLPDDAAYTNEFGLYPIDDDRGAIGDLLPGDDGYASAAVGHADSQVIFSGDVEAGSVFDVDLPADQRFGMFIIQDDTVANYLAHNPDNSVDATPLALFGFNAASPDDYDHLRFASPNIYAWEDLTYGGDEDFFDVVFEVEFGEPAGDENRPPVLDPIADRSIDEQTTLAFTATATDPDGDALTYTLGPNVPAGVTIDPASGAFAWTPGEADGPGVFDITVNVTDDGLPPQSDSKSFQVTVNCTNGEDFSAFVGRQYGGDDTTAGSAMATGCDATLVEGDSHLVELSASFVVPEEADSLSFNYAGLSFDETVNDFVNDAFEVALIDRFGNSLVTPHSDASDAFFNVTESVGVSSGAQAVVTGNRVSLDLTDVLPGEIATLVFRLIGNDSDTTTTVRLEELTEFDYLPPIRIQHPGIGPLSDPANLFAIDESRMSDVSVSFRAVYGSTTFDEKTDQLAIELAVENLGTGAIDTPLWLGFRNIRSPTVELVAADGSFSDGTPSIDISGWFSNESVGGGESSTSQTIAFFNPLREKFDYELVFLTPANQPPSITSEAVTAAGYGRPYRYDVMAADLDGDELSFELLIGPAEMIIDESTGLIGWSPTRDQIGLHDVLVAVRDGRGGSDEQRFQIAVNAPPPNRPPLITSTPVTTTTVFQPETIDWVEYANWQDGDFEGTGNSRQLDVSATINLVSGSLRQGPRFESIRTIADPQWPYENGEFSQLGIDTAGTANYSVSFDYLNPGGLPAGGSVFVADAESPGTSVALSGFRGGQVVDVNWQVTFLEVSGANAAFPVWNSETNTLVGTTSVDRRTFNLAFFVTDVPLDRVVFDVISGNEGIGFNSAAQSAELQGYLYDVAAIDPDDDTLSYVLADGPEGMRIDDQSGLINWRPTADQIGNHDVVVEVADGRGGAAVQNFIVCVHPDPENHPPVIVSAPVTNITISDPMTPTEYSGVEFPLGDLSFADSVVDLQVGSGVVAQTADNALGPPTAAPSVTLGNGGSIVIEFKDNLLVDQDAVEGGLDLYIYEAGPDVEAFDVEISENGVNWISLGRVTGQPTGIDIAPFVSPDQSFRFVRITDDPDQGDTGGPSPGADIDAVGAIGSRPSDGMYRYDVQAIDPDNDELSFSLVESPPDMSIDAASGLIEWTPSLHDVQVDPRMTFLSQGGGAAPQAIDLAAMGLSPGDRIRMQSVGNYQRGNGQLRRDLIGVFSRTDTVLPKDSSDVLIPDAIDAGDDVETLSGVQIVEDFIITDDSKGIDHVEIVVPEDARFLFVGPDDSRYFDNSDDDGDFGLLITLAEVPVAIRVEDGRGGVNKQEFSIVVGRVGEGTIRGSKFAYTNAGGESDDGLGSSGANQDSGIEGWTIYLDENRNGVRDVGERSTVTDKDGDYVFAGLPEGAYDVREELRPGWLQVSPGNQDGQFFGPLPYLSRGDSPFDPDDFDRYFLEDFEDGELNIPGVTFDFARDFGVSSGLKISVGGGATDSVDEDDGVIDGSGSFGGVLSPIGNPAGGASQGVEFDFDATVLGAFPSHVGIVWTDGSSNETVIFEAIDSAGGVVVSTRNPGIGDGSFFGTTAEDRFFGAFAFNGIRAIRIYGEQLNRNSFEVDHLQIGFGGASDFHRIHLSEGQLVENVDFYNREVSNGMNRSPLVSSLPITLAIADVPYRYDALATDPENDSLTFSLPVAPDGMTVHPTLGTLVWLPGFDQVGTHDVLLQVSDGRGGFVTQPFTLTVNRPNVPPVITTAVPKTAVATRNLVFPLTGQDADGDTITFRLTDAPDGMSIRSTDWLNPDGVILDTVHELVWNVPADAAGTSPVVTAVADDGMDEVTQTFKLNVLDANTANTVPTIDSAPPPIARRITPWVYAAASSDGDGDSLTWSLAQAPAGMQVSADGIVTWTPPLGGDPSVAVELVVHDGQGGQAVQSFDLEIRPLGENSPPQIDSVPRDRAVLNEAYAYDVVSSDPDVDPLTYRLTAAPRGMSVDPRSGAIRWTPDDRQLGTHTVTLTATDPFGGNATQRFELHVGCNNVPPAIVSVPPTVALTERTYQYAARADDLENDPLSWSLDAAPDGMTIDPLSGLIRWIPTLDQIAPQTIVIEVSDGLSVASQNYTLVVNASDDLADPSDPSKGTKGNRPPVITSQPRFAAETDAVYQYQVTAIEPDGDAFSISLGGTVPAGMTVDGGGLITWTPAVADAGDYLITVLATDEQGATSNQSYLLNVAINLPPEITSSPVETVAAGAVYRYGVLANDADGDPLNYRLDDGPSGLTIDTQGRIQWTTAGFDGSTADVSFTVADDRGQTDSQSFTIALVPDAAAPAVALSVVAGAQRFPGDATVDLGSSFTVQLSASDNVGITEIGLSKNAQPTGLSSPIFPRSVTFTADAVGTIEFVGTATDAAGLIGTATITVTVVDPAGSNQPVPTDPTLPAKPDFDPADNQSPIVVISSPEPASTVTNQVSIVGTVDDPEDNLWYYRAYYARVDRVALTGIDLQDPDWTIFKESTSEVINGELAVFDTSLVTNDPYAIVIAAFDSNGQGFIRPTVVYVEGNVQLGNFTLSLTDLSVPLAGIPIEVTRVYDTLISDDEGDFGFGWTLGVQDARILEVAAVGAGGALNGGNDKFVPDKTKVYLTGPDGRRVGFTYREELISASFFGGIWRPYFEADPGVYDTLTIDQTQVARGGLVGAVAQGINPSSYTLTTPAGLRYRYHEIDGLQTITDRNGNIVTFSDEGVEHSTGQSIEFVRDHRGRIERIIDPVGNEVRYQYDLAGNLISVTDQAGLNTQFEYLDTPAHYLDEITDPRGRRAAKAVYEPNPESGQLEFKGVIDALGNRIDDRDQNTDDNTAVIRDANGNTTTLVYDDRGNVLTETDPLGGVTAYEYGDPENPDLETRITDANGNAEVRRYDLRGNLLSTTDGNGATTSFRHSTANELTSITDALSRVTTLTYDASGNLVTVTDPLGNRTRLTYDTSGRVKSQTDRNGHTTQFEYFDADSLPDRVRNPDGSERSFQYNVFGQVTTLTDELGSQFVTQYDAVGRRTRETAPNGQSLIFVYDGQLLVSQTDALGNETRFEYDDADRLIRQIDAEGGVVSFAYDATGNRTALTDPVGNTTSWAYDSLNRVQSETDPLGAVKTFAYDAVGNQIEIVDRLGRRREFEFDAADRLIEETWFGNGGDLVNTITSRYDAVGNLLSRSDFGSSYTFTYDPLNRTITQDNVGTPDVPNVVLTYAYDAEGNRVSVSDSDGVTITSVYGSRNELLSKTWTGGEVDDARIEFDYDAQGNRTAVRRYADSAGTNPIGRTIYGYDASGRTEDIRHLDATDTVIADYDYAYDLVDRSIQESHHGDTIDYAYDRTGQLLGAIHSNDVFPDEFYRYDANGNRVESHLHGSGYVTGPGNQLLSDGDFNYEYDSEGSLIRKTEIATGNVTTYEYDHLNRLTRITERAAGGVIVNEVEQRYDVFGRRIAEITNGNELYMIYDGDNVWTDYDGTGTVTARYLFGDRIDENLARWRPGEGTAWYLVDRLGSVRDVVGQSGLVVGHVDYDSFGRVLGEDGGGADRYGFTGRERVRTEGLTYFRSRTLDYGIGRFTQVDTIGFSAGDANLYRYVANDPLNGRDPDGKLVVRYAERALRALGQFAAQRQVQRCVAITFVLVAVNLQQPAFGIPQTVRVPDGIARIIRDLDFLRRQQPGRC